MESRLAPHAAIAAPTRCGQVDLDVSTREHRKTGLRNRSRVRCRGFVGRSQCVSMKGHRETKRTDGRVCPGGCISGLPELFCARPLPGHQPVCAHVMDRPGRVRCGHRLRDGPDSRRLSLARYGIRSGWLRWGSQGFLATACGQLRPYNGAYSLVVTRDGTLWIGTFQGLATRDGSKPTRYPELDGQFVISMLEDREGTVWAGALAGSLGTPTGRLCAIQGGRAQCHAQDSAFGRADCG
jgi:hypothetical protein